jgi:hypothetical protein
MAEDDFMVMVDGIPVPLRLARLAGLARLPVYERHVYIATEEDTAEHVRQIVEDVTAGRVAPKQIDEIEEAIHKHQANQAVHRAIRSG